MIYYFNLLKYCIVSMILVNINYNRITVELNIILYHAVQIHMFTANTLLAKKQSRQQTCLTSRAKITCRRKK